MSRQFVFCGTKRHRIESVGMACPRLRFEVYNISSVLYALPAFCYWAQCRCVTPKKLMALRQEVAFSAAGDKHNACTSTLHPSLTIIGNVGVYGGAATERSVAEERPPMQSLFLYRYINGRSVHGI